MAMTPAEFAVKWTGSAATERAAAQEHFIDLCRLLGVPTPNEADPTGADYAFEKGAEKVGGGDGFADVWKRGHFAWEYKGKRKNLSAAYQQLLHDPKPSTDPLGGEGRSGRHPIFCRMRLDHPFDHPDDPSVSVWSRLDRRSTQREQARSVWSRPGRRRASDS